jgi:hypothetical protein
MDSGPEEWEQFGYYRSVQFPPNSLTDYLFTNNETDDTVDTSPTW